jgi:hypothetical protein
MSSRKRRGLLAGALGGLGAGMVARAEREHSDAREDAATAHADAREDARNAREDTLLLEREARARAAEIRDQLIRNEEIRGQRADSIAESTAGRVSDENEASAERISREETARLGRESAERIAGMPSRSRGLLGSGGSEDGSGLSAGENRAIQAAAEPFTTAGEDGKPVTDWHATSNKLRQEGFPELADLVDPGYDQKPTDVNSAEYMRAEQMADEWIGNQAGWLSGDATDFKDFGGNRTDARAAKVNEFYGQITGKGRGQPSSTAPAAQASNTPPDDSAAGAVAGLNQQDSGQLPEGIPPGSKLIGKTRAGADVYEAPNGERYAVE